MEFESILRETPSDLTSHREDDGCLLWPEVANPTALLHEACRQGHVGHLISALSQGAAPDAPDETGWRPLHHAAQHGASACCRVLLRAGASVRARDEHAQTFDGADPLHVAVAAGHTRIVELLLRAGADPDRRDDAGFTPLHTAAAAGHAGIVKALLIAGASPRPWLADHTPLDLARQGGHRAVCALLRQASRTGTDRS